MHRAGNEAGSKHALQEQGPSRAAGGGGAGLQRLTRAAADTERDRVRLHAAAEGGAARDRQQLNLQGAGRGVCTHRHVTCMRVGGLCAALKQAQPQTQLCSQSLHCNTFWQVALPLVSSTRGQTS